jgi:hypothetical protein
MKQSSETNYRATQTNAKRLYLVTYTLINSILLSGKKQELINLTHEEGRK